MFAVLFLAAVIVAYVACAAFTGFPKPVKPKQCKNAPPSKP